MAEVTDVFAGIAVFVEHAQLTDVALSVRNACFTQPRAALFVHRAAAIEAIANERRTRVIAASRELLAGALHASAGVAHALAGNVRALGVRRTSRAHARIASRCARAGAVRLFQAGDATRGGHIAKRLGVVFAGSALSAFNASVVLRVARWFRAPAGRCIAALDAAVGQGQANGRGPTALALAGARARFAVCPADAATASAVTTGSEITGTRIARARGFSANARAPGSASRTARPAAFRRPSDAGTSSASRARHAAIRVRATRGAAGESVTRAGR